MINVLFKYSSTLIERKEGMIREKAEVKSTPNFFPLRQQSEEHFTGYVLRRFKWKTI